MTVEELRKEYPETIAYMIPESSLYHYAMWLEQKLIQPCKWADYLLLGIYLTGCNRLYTNMINDPIQFCPYCGHPVEIDPKG